MKAVCKRTYFETNSNFFKIMGKGYDENWIKWEKNKIYSMRDPEEYESKIGMYKIVETEAGFWSPITKKNFDRYFTGIDDVRNEKINRLLK